MSFLSKRKKNTANKNVDQMSTMPEQPKEEMVLFYAVTSYWDKPSKTRKKLQVYVGRQSSFDGYKFNYKALYWKSIFKGTDLEQIFLDYVKTHPQLKFELNQNKEALDAEVEKIINKDNPEYNPK